uniref:ORF2a protein n=1 Tax=Streptomyces phage phiC31 TaxID=10719 RepID=Q37835_BPPHC|nr:ORF2a [Lomovskayavirus C31]
MRSGVLLSPVGTTLRRRCVVLSVRQWARTVLPAWVGTCHHSSTSTTSSRLHWAAKTLKATCKRCASDAIRRRRQWTSASVRSEGAGRLRSWRRVPSAIPAPARKTRAR